MKASPIDAKENDVLTIGCYGLLTDIQEKGPPSHASDPVLRGFPQTGTTSLPSIGVPALRPIDEGYTLEWSGDPTEPRR